jgi:flavodoxin
MKYVEVGNTEIAVQHITELTGYDSFKLEMVQPYSADSDPEYIFNGGARQ